MPISYNRTSTVEDLEILLMLDIVKMDDVTLDAIVNRLTEIRMEEFTSSSIKLYDRRNRVRPRENINNLHGRRRLNF